MSVYADYVQQIGTQQEMAHRAQQQAQAGTQQQAQGKRMSLYADYVQERTNDKVMEIPEGFATYRYLTDDKTVYIIDIYIMPEHRNNGAATKLADLIVAHAKELNCTQLIGSVVPSTKNSTDSVKVLLAYGMSLNSANNDFVVFRKEI